MPRSPVSLSVAAVRGAANRAYVVRAEDPPGFVPLPDADLEVAQLMRCFRLLGLEALAEVQPGVAALIEALDADIASSTTREMGWREVCLKACRWPASRRFSLTISAP